MKLNLTWLVTFLLTLSIQLFNAQENKITGTIKDANGLPIEGVTVLIEGTNRGVVSDFDGNYGINAKTGDVLKFTFIGMKTKSITVGSTTNINVTLIEDLEDLDTVVVTGYQKIDRKLFTGSAQTLKQEDIKLEGVADVSRAIQGQVAGVEVENVSGTFGAAPVIRIRGNSSINGVNRPLWVIDGVVLEDAVELSNQDITTGNLETILSSSTAGIGPNDIETFTVLKDASATAQYGARALNGVIVITTKRGKTGKPNINFSSSLTTRTKPTYDQFNILSSGDELSVYQELFEKSWLDIANTNSARNHGVFSDMFLRITNNQLNWGAGGSPNYNYLQRYANANTDWFDVLFKDSYQFTNTFSISSGTDKSRYRASISYLNDLGQTVADNAKNYTANLNADFNLSDKFSVGFKLTGNVRDQRIAASQDREFDALSGVFERNFDINPFNFALYSSRSMTPYDENGNLQFFRRNWAPFNILHEIENNFTDLNLVDVSLQANLDWKFNKNLTFANVLQGRWYRSNAVQSVTEDSNNAEAYRADNPLLRNNNIFLFDDPDAPELDPYSVLPNGGFRKTTDNTLDNFFMRNSLNYSNKFNNVHQVDILLGQEIRSSNRSRTFNDGWGYLFNKGGLVLSDPNFIRFLDSRGEDYFEVEETKNRAWGTFFTGAYAYDSKYIINGTFTYFGDNRTGDSRNARYLPTWNVSGAWNIHQEAFMDSASWINLLKLKTTYGLSGSNPFDASAGLILRGDEPLRPQLSEREIALVIDQVENSELTFEKLFEWNIGLEAAFFNNRFGFEVEYYRRTSEDLIGFVETNGVGGQGFKLGNIGELDREGYEISFRTTNIETDNFRWTTNFNYSFSESEITKWESRDRIGDAISRNGGNFVGFPANALFSVPFAGLDSNGVPTFFDEEGEITQQINLQNRDDILGGLKYEGPTEPTFFGGFNNTLTYKNLDFSFGFAYRGGNKIRLDDLYRVRLNDGSARLYDDFSSLPGELINRWALPGDENITNIPSILTEGLVESLRANGLNPYDLYNKSDIRVADGDFVRLKNVKLTYRLPGSVMDNTFFSAASISLSAHNLWLIYSDDKLNGVDPEFFQTGGVSLPLNRTYTFTVNFNF